MLVIPSQSSTSKTNFALIKRKEVFQYHQKVYQQAYDQIDGPPIWKRCVLYFRTCSPLDEALTLDDPKSVIASLEFINHRLESKLKLLLSRAEKEQLKFICKCVNEYALYNGREVLIDRLAERIDLKRLEELVDGSEHIKAILKDRAERYPSVFRSRPSVENTPLQKKLSLFGRFLHKIFRIGEMLFGFKDTIQRHNERFEAVHKFELYCKVILFPVTLFSVITPLFFSVWITAMIAASILLIGAIAITAYYQWIKGCPEDLPEWRNLTNDMVSGKIQAQTVINQSICNIYHHVVTSLKGKMPIRLLIVGESGVGKTETILGVTRLLLERQHKDFRVFYTDAGELMTKPLFTTPIQALDDIQKEVDGYEQNALFVIDEFHAIGTKPELKNHFKRLLESNSIAALNFIGITTPQEYKDTIKQDNALAGRFDLICLKEPDELVTILTHYAEPKKGTEFPVHFSKKAIKKIIEVSNENNAERKQPAAGIKLIDQIKRRVIEMYSGRDAELERLESKKIELEAILRQRPDLDVDKKRGIEIRNQIDAIRNQIEEKNKRSVKGKKRLAIIEYLKSYKANLIAQTWEWARRVESCHRPRSEVELLKKRFIMAKYFSFDALNTVKTKVRSAYPFNDDLPYKVTEVLIGALLVKEE